MNRPAALIVAAVAVLLGALTGCSTVTSGEPVASPTGVAAVKAEKVSAADRSVCVDFDARGGGLYNVFVVPMMTGPAGQRSIDVDAAQMTRAASSLTAVGDGTNLAAASPKVREEAQRMVAAAEALGIYNNTEGTALLTSFVGLAAQCQLAGHKPSWFDATKLSGS